MAAIDPSTADPCAEMAFSPNWAPRAVGRLFASGAIALVALLAAGPIATATEVDAILVQADAEANKQHTRAAITLLMKAEKLEPQNAGVLLRLARQYSDLVDQTASRDAAEKALDYSKRALVLAPGNAKAHLSVAVSYGKMVDFVGNKTKVEYSKIIKEEAEKSLAIDQSDSFCWYLLGRWHFGVANVNGVLRALAAIIYGGLPPATNEEAIRCYKKAIELAPKEMMHHSALARAYDATGKKELALKHWKVVYSLEPNDAEEVGDRKDAAKALGIKN